MSDDPWLTEISPDDIKAAMQRKAAREALIVEQAAEITRLHAALRWCIERDGDDLLICEGNHERHEGCTIQRWAKAENVATARRDALAEIKQDTDELIEQGRQDGMEQAAQWHDEQAAQAQKLSDMKVSALDAKVWGDYAANHREYAAAIRAAAGEGK